MHEDLPAIGSLVGPWLILGRLDSGSFGVVFHARLANQPDSPPVAVKVAKWPEDPRFEREDEVLQSNNHPSIPRYEGGGLWIGPSGLNYPYLVMECVKGSRLYPWFRERPRSSLDVLQVLVQLAGALASTHRRGVIHRDVKGDNIRVTPEGRAVLLDWGSCWLPSAPPLTDSPAPPSTHAYRPPEQLGFMYTHRKDDEARWESRPSDDMYALGVTLYRLVTGSYLPPCTDGGGLVERQVLKPSAMATVSPVLEALILRLISDEPEARGTAEQLVREAMALMQAAGADEQPIIPTPAAQSTEDGLASSDGWHNEESLSDTDSAQDSARSSPHSREERREPIAPLTPLPFWLSLASAGLVSGVVVALVVLLVRPGPPEPATSPTPRLATPEEVAQFAPDAGVGEEALMAVMEEPSAEEPALLSLARAMPSKPFEWQKRPPCAPKTQRAINGGCWFGPVATQKPPCGAEAFDYDDGCYMPVATPPRQPNAVTP
jgi:serine/threonine protein kinase